MTLNLSIEGKNWDELPKLSAQEGNICRTSCYVKNTSKILETTYNLLINNEVVKARISHDKKVLVTTFQINKRKVVKRKALNEVTKNEIFPIDLVLPEYGIKCQTTVK